MGEDAEMEATLAEDQRAEASIPGDNQPLKDVELKRVIAGIHELLPGARGVMVVAFLPDGATAVFGDMPPRLAAPAFRKWAHKVLVGKNPTGPK